MENRATGLETGTTTEAYSQSWLPGANWAVTWCRFVPSA